MDWKRIKFVCSECLKESWFEVDIDTYVIEASNLVCDDCNPAEED